MNRDAAGGVERADLAEDGGVVREVAVGEEDDRIGCGGERGAEARDRIGAAVRGRPLEELVGVPLVLLGRGNGRFAEATEAVRGEKDEVERLVGEEGGDRRAQGVAQRVELEDHGAAGVTAEDDA